MRLWLGMFGAVVLAAAVVAGTASASSVSSASQSASAKTCYKGYVPATFSWGQRCVRSGQYCKVKRNPEYRKYKFECKRGKLRKLPAKKPKR